MARPERTRMTSRVGARRRPARIALATTILALGFAVAITPANAIG
jgi:hypothetical protein